jgi:hypothetical protein
VIEDGVNRVCGTLLKYYCARNRDKIWNGAQKFTSIFSNVLQMSEFDEGILEFGDVCESTKEYLTESGYSTTLEGGRSYRIPTDSHAGIVLNLILKKYKCHFARYVVKDGKILYSKPVSVWGKEMSEHDYQTKMCLMDLRAN